MDMPEFMKLMECECGWTLYSIYAQPQECPKCYEMINKEAKDGINNDSTDMVSS